MQLLARLCKCERVLGGDVMFDRPADYNLLFEEDFDSWFVSKRNRTWLSEAVFVDEVTKFRWKSSQG